MSPVLAELSGPLQGLAVLLVEDDDDARELLFEVLAGGGARVTAAASVAEATLAFARERPSVLISDVGMPGKTGYDLIRFVRALPPEKGGKVPAAALTAYTRAEERRRLLDAGFDLHVPKPVLPTSLIEATSLLARLMGRGERPR